MSLKSNTILAKLHLLKFVASSDIQKKLYKYVQVKRLESLFVYIYYYECFWKKSHMSVIKNQIVQKFGVSNIFERK